MLSRASRCSLGAWARASPVARPNIYLVYTGGNTRFAPRPPVDQAASNATTSCVHPIPYPSVERVLCSYSSAGSLRMSPHVAQLASIPFNHCELSDDGGSTSQTLPTSHALKRARPKAFLAKSGWHPAS